MGFKNYIFLIEFKMKNTAYIVFLLFFLSSCKIFKSNKSNSPSAETHSHTKNSSEKTKVNSSQQTENLIGLARTYKGVPYRSGGTTEAGMDCSGLIYTVCQNAGLSIPRISYQQAEIGQEISINEIQKGDFVFFRTANNSSRISHVGMVTEVSTPQNITFIHSSTSKGVREDNLFSDYWKKAFAKATRPFVF